ncbi:MAG: ROK family protein [Rhizobiaceae bacterium]|nr:ROK family protein [Rhizobiaceae bacterium]
MRALAIDLGGTNIRAGISEEDALAPRLLGRWPAPASLDELRQRLASLLADSGAAKMGICIPGLARNTVCAWVPNLPFLDSVDFAALFPDVRVTLGNDAQFALLAEAVGGAAREVDNAILLAIGTGIGSAVLADGRILRGAGGAATSFGWACADTADQGSDVHGWLERTASGTAFDRIAAGLGYADGRALMTAVREGDEEPSRAVEPAAAALGTALAGAVALTGAARLIFAGGVVESLDVLGHLLRPALTRQLPPHLRDVEIAAGEFGTQAGLVGAGLAAHGHPIWAEDRP